MFKALDADAYSIQVNCLKNFWQNIYVFSYYRIFLDFLLSDVIVYLNLQMYHEIFIVLQLEHSNSYKLERFLPKNQHTYAKEIIELWKLG